MVSKIVIIFAFVFILVLMSHSKSDPLPKYPRYFVNDYDETYVFGLSDDDRRNFHHHTERDRKSTTTNDFKTSVGRSLKETTEGHTVTKPPQSAKAGFDIFGGQGPKSLDDGTTYLGCYDNWNNNSQYAVKTMPPDNTNTPAECTVHCKIYNYQLAFLKGDLCVCTHASHFNLIRVPNVYCDVECADNESSCGGNFVYSVYCSEPESQRNCSSLIRPFHPIDIYRPTQGPPANDSEYDDDHTEQDFNTNSLRRIPCASCDLMNCGRRGYLPDWDYMPKNSPEACVAFCKRPVLYLKDDEYLVRNTTKYAILVLDTTTTSTTPLPVCSCQNNVSNLEEVETSHCDFPCPGDPNTICGGVADGGYISVYCTDPETCKDDADYETTTTTENSTTEGTDSAPTTAEIPTTPNTTEDLTTTTTTEGPTTPTTTESPTTPTTESPTTPTTTKGLTTPTTTEDPTTPPTTEEPTTPPTTEDPTTPTTTESPTTTTKDPSTTTIKYSESTTTIVTMQPTTTRSSTGRPTVTPTFPADCRKCRKTDARGKFWEGCAGDLVKKSCSESSSSPSMATWACDLDGNFASRQPDYSNCRTEWLDKLNKTVDTIDHLDRAEDFLTEVDKHCKESQDGSTGEKYYGHEIEGIIGVVEKASAIAVGLSNDTEEYETIAEKVLNISSVILSFKDPWIELDQHSQSKASNQILSVIEKTIFDLTSKVEVGQNYSTRLDDTKSDISVTGISMPKPKRRNNGTIVYTSLDGSTMTLPPGWQNIVEGDQIHVIYMFLDAKIARRTMPGQYKLIGNSDEDEPGGKLINGQLMSCSIGNSQSAARSHSQPIHFEGKGVEITFRHDVQAWGEEAKEIKRKLHNGEQAKAVLGSAQCVFWDTKELEWSTDGCRVISSDRYSTTCECEHLTSFAILMDTHKYVGKNLGLEILTLILCPLSIICLVISIVIFTTVRSIQNPRTTITKHLSICLLIGITLVLLVVDRNYFDMNDGMCIASGIISHYVFLCAFLWMAIEGLHLYKMVVHVFDSANDYTRMYSMIAYGVPILIVAITVATGYSRGHEPYGGDIYCWLDGSYIWSFLVPVSLVVAGNLIVLFITLKTAYQLQHNNNIMQSRVRTYRTWLRGCFSVTVLLGVTWMFGFFILTNSVIAGVVAGYFFTLLNASQGIFLFVFHCLLNEKVRAVAERTLPLPSWLSSSSLNPSQSFMGKTSASHMRSFDSGGSKNSDFPFRVSSISSRPDGMGETKVVRRGSINRRNESLASLSSTGESRRTSDTGSTTDGSQNFLMEPRNAQTSTTC